MTVLADALLRDWYREHFRPILCATITAGRVAIYDRAVTLFDRNMGGRIRLAAISEAKLAAFIAKRIKRRRGPHSEKHRRELAGCIRKIVRAWNADALQPARMNERALTPIEAGSQLEYFETVYLPQVLFDCSELWQDQCRWILRRIDEHFGRPIMLAELTDALAADHLRWLRDNGLSAGTVNQHRAAWFALWRHAHGRGLVATLPSVKKLRSEVEEPDSWSLEEFARILAAALQFQPERTYDGVPRNLWWYALLLVNWYTALRRSSLVSIRRSDVNLDTGWLTVRGAKMKTKHGKKLRLGSDAIDAVQRIWLPQRDLLFPHQSKCQQLDHFTLILAAAEIPAGNHPAALDRFHKIRRTAATHVAAVAGELAASALLGHCSLDLTRRSYLDPSRLPGNDATAALPTLPNVYEYYAKGGGRQ